MPKLIVSDPASPTRQPRANPDTFGAGIGRAQQGLAQSVQGLAKPIEAMSAMRARRSAAEFSSALEAEANALSLSPDIEGAPEALRQTRKRLEAQYRKGNGSIGAFDAQAAQSARAIENRFMHRNNQRAIQQGQHDLEETLTLFSDEMARAGDPSERATTMLKGEIAIEDARRIGIIDDIQVDKIKDAYSKKAMGGILRRMLVDEPAEGLAYLESGQFSGTEEERQVWRGHMQVAMRTRVSAEISQIRRDEAAERAYKRRVSAQAEVSLIEKSLGEGFTEEDVLAFSDVFSASQLRNLLSTARGGGKFIATKSNPVIFDELRQAARAAATDVEIGGVSQEFGEAIRSAFLRGELTQGDYTSLEAIAEDSSVNDFLDRIEDTISGGLLVGPADKRKADQATRSFLSWLKQRNEAGDPPSLEEREAFVDRQIESANIIADSGSGALNLVPSSLVGTIRDPQVDETRRVIRARLESGEIDEIEAAIESDRLKRLSDSVKAKAAKKAAAGEGSK